MLFDIAIIGGGPSGAVAARQLAKLNYQVCLILGESRRSHSFESLPPSVSDLLESIGLTNEFANVASCHAEPPQMRWGEISEAAAIGKTTKESPVFGYHVDRILLDKMLLDSARQAGCTIIQPGIVNDVVRNSQDTWTIRLNVSGRNVVSARFLIDATGRSSLLRDCRRVTHGPQTVALIGNWRTPEMNCKASLVEAGRHEWYWGAPAAGKLFTAVVFMNAEELRSSKRQSVLKTYTQKLKNSVLLRRCLDGTLDDSIRICDATPRSVQTPIDDNWIKTGDSAFAPDPISSHGVQLALTSALRAVAVVNTMLQNSKHAVLANEFYRSRHRGTIDDHLQNSREAYHRQWSVEPNSFWKSRCEDFRPRTEPVMLPELNPYDVVSVSPSVRIVETGVLRNDQIEPTDAVQIDGRTEPLAFLGRFQIAPLIADCIRPVQADVVMAKWARQTGVRTALKLITELRRLRILTVTNS